MKHLWIGVCNSEEGRAEIVAKGGKLLSAEVSNDAFLVGFAECGVFVDSINSSRLPTYPQYPDIRISYSTWTTKENNIGVNVDYWNLPYINLLSKRKSLIREAKKWANAYKKEDVCIWIYQMHSPFMSAAKAVKKIIPNAKIILIVPDLPQYMDMNMSKLKKILKSVDWKNICNLMKYVDKYVLYTKHMANFLALKDGTWMVMEGSFDLSIVIDDCEIIKDSHKISVMYSGALDLRYGIRELLNAMDKLDDRYELWLTGNGNAVPLIEERAKTDPRIKFYGFLPSRMDLLRKQHEATMLISTRDPSEAASKYCFPSKIFEYMVSGNPVISTVIEGIPDEYFEHLVALPDIRSETIAEKIRFIGDMTAEERCTFGTAARDFVLENKNNVAQMKRVLDFIK